MILVIETSEMVETCHTELVLMSGATHTSSHVSQTALRGGLPVGFQVPGTIPRFKGERRVALGSDY